MLVLGYELAPAPVLGGSGRVAARGGHTILCRSGTHGGLCQGHQRWGQIQETGMRKGHCCCNEAKKNNFIISYYYYYYYNYFKGATVS